MAYDRGAGRLYAINRLSSTYRVLAINPASGSITNSFVVPAPFTVPQGLTFGGGYLYIADMYQSRILKTTTTGSVVSSINPGVFAIKGLAWDGTYLWACQNYMGQDMYAFRFIAYEPYAGISPASLGKIKSLYR